MRGLRICWDLFLRLWLGCRGRFDSVDLAQRRGLLNLVRHQVHSREAHNLSLGLEVLVTEGLLLEHLLTAVDHLLLRTNKLLGVLNVVLHLCLNQLRRGER